MFCDDLRASFKLKPMHKFKRAGQVRITAVFMTDSSEKFMMPHKEKPDASNILKGVEDALIENDESVYHVDVAKQWGPVDLIQVELQDVEYAETDLSD